MVVRLVIPGEVDDRLTNFDLDDELILRLSNLGYTVFAVFKPDCHSEDSMEVSEVSTFSAKQRSRTT